MAKETAADLWERRIAEMVDMLVSEYVLFHTQDGIVIFMYIGSDRVSHCMVPDAFAPDDTPQGRLGRALDKPYVPEVLQRLRSRLSKEVRNVQLRDGLEQEITLNHDQNMWVSTNEHGFEMPVCEQYKGVVVDLVQLTGVGAAKRVDYADLLGDMIRIVGLTADSDPVYYWNGQDGFKLHVPMLRFGTKCIEAVVKHQYGIAVYRFFVAYRTLGQSPQVWVDPALPQNPQRSYFGFMEGEKVRLIRI
jgi:hypothetical protein